MPSNTKDGTTVLYRAVDNAADGTIVLCRAPDNSPNQSTGKEMWISNFLSKR